jgi:tRNA pseudouridine38-40 synthase
LSLFEDEHVMPAAPSGPLVRVRLTVAYHGAGFRGIAAQPGQRTVAGVLGAAIERVLRHPVDLAVAGRTDAGVHAWGQVVAFDASEGTDVEDLARRCNKMLAPEVVVRSAAVAPAGFDPRRWATGRRYRYTVLHRAVPDPWLADTSWWVPEPLDLRTMRAACDPLLGVHDFTSFCRKQGDASLVREVREADWLDLGHGLLRFEVEASSFCQQRVRAIVGTLVDAGRGKRTAADVLSALRAKDRSAAGQVAPPHGLCLWDVTYEATAS